MLSYKVRSAMNHLVKNMSGDTYEEILAHIEAIQKMVKEDENNGRDTDE
ncbi:hypothetical protein [Bacillus cereus]|nr:hypothetical protein [Bacillus cereus]